MNEGNSYQDLLIEWKINFKNRAENCYRASRKYGIISKIINSTAIIAASITTLIGIKASSDLNSSWGYTTACLGGLGVTLKTLSMVWKLEKSEEQFKHQYEEYHKIIMLIDKELVLKKTDPDIFITNIIKYYQNIEQSNLSLPPNKITSPITNLHKYRSESESIKIDNLNATPTEI